MSIHQNISEDCGVREEGCRVIGKQQGHLEWFDCTLVVIQVEATKSE